MILKLVFETKTQVKNQLFIKDKITINHPQNEISISGIQLMDKIEPSKTPSLFTKHNYDMYPLSL